MNSAAQAHSSAFLQPSCLHAKLEVELGGRCVDGPRRIMCVNNLADSLEYRTMRMMTFALLAVSLSACSHGAGSGPNGGAIGSGQGHIELAGSIAMNHDFIVDQCTVSPPGNGLINGYQAIMKSDPQMDTLSVKVANYEKDATFTPARQSREQQIGGMMHAEMGAIMLSVAPKKGSSPRLLMQTPGSNITIAISQQGLHGEAKFDNFEDPMNSMNERMQALSQGKTPGAAVPASGGKMISGTITWTCPEVKHLNAGAVNSMFNKLIPPNK